MPREGLTTLDWVVIAAYGAGMLTLGAFYARRQHSAEDFFVGGRKLNSTAVGISLLATLLSTISYMATPGEMIGKGPIISVGIIALPITFLVVGYGLLPFLMRYRVTSAYEMLETRLGLGPRMLAATMFLVLRLSWMGVMIHVAAIAVVGILRLDDEQARWAVPLAIVICGTVAVVYTALGGLRAVVTTDVVQFLLLFGGALLTIVLVTIKFGGFGWIPNEWQPHWERQPVFSYDPRVRVTVVGTILGGLLWWICTAGSDQTAIQRFMATGSTRAARKSFLINIIADMFTMALLALVGLAVLGFYSEQSSTAAGAVDLVKRGDKLFPEFIATQLPMGLAGLVVAAMFAAVMSSLDSGLNSTASVIITDFIRRFDNRPRTPKENPWLSRILTLVIGSRASVIITAFIRRVTRRPDTPEEELWLSRLLTLGMGFVIVWMAMVVQRVPGNILEMSQKTVGLLVAPLFGIFFVALFVRFGTAFGAMFGAWYSFTVAFVIAFWDMITGGATLSFQWITPCSLVTSMVVGVLFSLVPFGRAQSAGRVLWCVLAGLPVLASNVWIAVGLIRQSFAG